VGRKGSDPPRGQSREGEDPISTLSNFVVMVRKFQTLRSVWLHVHPRECAEVQGNVVLISY